MGYGPPQVVEGQPRVGLPFGLFSALTLRESGDPHWANGIEWEAMTCGPVSGITDPNCNTNVNKFFRQMTTVGSATAFTVYGSAKCGAPGGAAYQEAEEMATAHLLAREEAQAEVQTWARLAAGATRPRGDTALKPGEALATLEDWLGGTYGSLGVIHGSRGAVTKLDTLVEKTGSRLTSKVGTPVVAGSGYYGQAAPAGGATATASQAWMLASPALFGYRGQVFSAQTFDQNKNDVYALAERNYVVGFDPCGVVAVLMDISG
jgi:hypothetical protein